MKRTFGRTLFLVLIAALAVVVLFLRTEYAAGQACALARERLPGLTGLDVQLGRCVLDPVRGGVELFDVALGQPGEKVPLFAADRVLVRVRALDVVGQSVRLERVEVEHPRVHLDLAKLLPKDEAPEKKQAGCLLDEAKRVAIDSLAVSGAELKVIAPTGETVQLDELDLDLKLRSRSYSVRVVAPSGRFDNGKLTVPLTRLRVSTALDMRDERLSVQRVELGAGELSLFARGDVQTLCTPQPNVEVVLNTPLELLSAVAGDKLPRMSGNVSVEARLEGGLADPLVETEITLARAQVDRFDIGDVYLRASYAQEQVAIQELNLSIGDGTARIAGSIGTTGKFPAQARAEIKDVEFARVLDKVGITGAWVNFTANGKVEVKGELWPFHLNGPASLDLDTFRVHDRSFERQDREVMLQFDQAHVDTVADFTTERVRLGRTRIRTPKSAIDADAILSTNPDIGLDASVTLEKVDLSELGHVASLPWGGVVSGTGTLKGAYGPEVRVEGRLAASDFRFHALDLGQVETGIVFHRLKLEFPEATVLKGRSRFGAQGWIDFGGSAPVAKARASMENARVADLLQIIGDELWLFDHLRGRMDGRASGEAVFVEGPMMRPTANITLSLDDATYFERKLGRGDVLVRIANGETLDIDRLHFDGPSGRLSFTGGMRFDESLDFVVDAPELSVTELLKPDGVEVNGSGRLSGKARMFGTPDHPLMDGDIDVENLDAYGLPLGSGRLKLAMDGKDLSVKGPIGEDLLVDLRLHNDGDLPFAIGASANTLHLERYVSSVEGLRGSLSGEVLATGTLERWREMEGNIYLSSLTVGKGDYLARNDGNAELSFRGSALEVRQLSLRGPTGTRLSLNGYKDAAGGLDLQVEGGFDVKLVESFTHWIEQSAGRVMLSASISGTSARPVVVGSAELEGGRFSVHDWPVSARGLNGRFEFSQNKILVSEVEGSVNGGRAALQGVIELKEFKPHRLDLGVLADSVHMRLPESLPSTVSGELRLTGVLDNLVLYGDVDVLKARYTTDVEFEKMLLEIRRRRVDARSFAKQDEWLRYDVTLNVNGDARIDNNLVKTALKGRLKLVGSNARWGLEGTLAAEDGGRGFFRGNEFSVTRAVIDFTERDRIAAIIDLHAQTQIREYAVNVHAFGPWDDPQVETSSEPALAKADVVTLLTLGFTSRDQGDTASAAGVSLVGETLFNISGLDKQLKKFIPANGILRDFNFQISTQYSEANLQAEPTAQFESKFLTDSLKLRLSQPMISGKGRRAQAEYRFNDHVSAQAQWDDQVSGYSFGDLGLDMKLRWELD